MNKVTVGLLLSLIVVVFIFYMVGQNRATSDSTAMVDNQPNNSNNNNYINADTKDPIHTTANSPIISATYTPSPSMPAAARNNPYYDSMKDSYMEVTDYNGVKLIADWYIDGQPPTRSEIINTINSPQLTDNMGNLLDMNSLVVMDNGEVILRSNGDRIDARIYVAPTEAPVPTLSPGSIPMVKDSPTDLTLTRDLSQPDTFRGAVDFNFHKGLHDGSLGVLNKIKFIDSRIAMAGIPRLSFDDDRPGSLLACYVLEPDGYRIWIDFNNISIYMSDGSVPSREAYVAAISEVAALDSEYNEVDTDQLHQFLTDDIVYQLHWKYLSYDEASKASADQSGVPDPSFFGRRPYVDVGVVEVSMEPKDAAGYYHGKFYVYDGESGELKTRNKSIHINEATGLMDFPQ